MPDLTPSTLPPPAMPSGEEGPSAKYWAFISYSHRDRKWGEWLHRELETFRIPKRLKRVASRHGILPEKLFPIFRDREELPVSADLGRNIAEALRLSRFLIVICSPAAARSRWVNEEILTFKRMGRSDRVLALIVDGEPNVSDGKPGFEPDQECFPEALRYAMQADGTLGALRAEPIAADARPGQDGRENSLLKLLAGLLGVNYDDLRQREHERKIRRLRAIVAATFALLVVFIALGIALYFQRNYARAQHARAEAALEQVRQTLSRSDYLQAVDAVSTGATPEALAYLARSVRTNPRNDSATDLLVSILAYRRWPLLVGNPFPLGSEVGPAIFDSYANQVFFAEGVDTWHIMDVATGRIVASGALQPPRLASAVFSKDGKWVASLSGPLGEPSSAQVWNTQNGQAAFPSLTFASQVNAIAVSPDGAKALFPINDRIEIRDLRTGAISEPLLKLENIVLGAAFSPDGSRIVGNQLFETVLLDATSGTPIGVPWKHDAIPQFYSFAPDGKTLGIALGDGTVRLWNVDDGEPIGAVLRHRSDLSSLRFDRAGGLLLSGARDATAVLWDAQTGLPVMEPMRHARPVIAAAFTQDESTVVTVAGGEGKPAQLQRWDVKREAWLQNVMTCEDRVVAMALHPDGRRLLSGCADGTIRLSDTTTRTPIGTPSKMEGEVTSCAFDSTGAVFATSAANAVMLWDTVTGKPRSAPMLHGDAVTSVVFSPDGANLLTTSLDGIARLWKVAATASPTNLVKQNDGMTIAAFSPDGHHFVTGANDKTAIQWDAQTGKPLGPAMVHESAISMIRFSPDGRLIATGSKDGLVHLWDSQSSRLLTAPLVNGREITAIIFAADGRTVATGAGEPGGQGTARIWNTQTGQPITDPMLHPDGVLSLALHPDGRRLVTGSFDGILRVWDYTMARPRFAPLRFDNPIVRLEFSPDGRHLFVASGNSISSIELIDPRRPPPGWLIALAERVGGLRLSEEGVLQPVSDRSTAALRDSLLHAQTHDDYDRFGHWFFALPRSIRAANPPGRSPPDR